METKRQLSIIAVATTFAVLVVVTLVCGQDLTRHTCAGGGGRSTGAGLEVIGTIGQSKAATYLSGGSFTLSSGFWFAVPPSDCNNDGGVNLLDFGPLQTCLVGPNAGLNSAECACYAAYPLTSNRAATNPFSQAQQHLHRCRAKPRSSILLGASRSCQARHSGWSTRIDHLRLPEEPRCQIADGGTNQ